MASEKNVSKIIKELGYKPKEHACTQCNFFLRKHTCKKDSPEGKKDNFFFTQLHDVIFRLSLLMGNQEGDSTFAVPIRR